MTAPTTPAQVLTGHTLPSEDVTVLLTTENIPRLVTVAEKEALLRAGHSYGELLTPEAPPSDLQQRTYTEALARRGPQTAALLATLAYDLHAHYGSEAVLVSLARAGTPVGCALRRLGQRWGLDWPHYTVSIIRGVGLDAVALGHIRAAHGGRPLVFIDGWTGKGSIFQTLKASLPNGCPPRLAVLSDPAGVALHVGTYADVLLPHAALNSTICGLLSRTFLPKVEGGQHGARLEEKLRPYDVSVAYLEALGKLCDSFAPPTDAAATGGLAEAREAAGLTERPRPQDPFAAVWKEAQLRGAEDPHLVKPSVGEATRVFLRRRPAALWVRDPAAADVQHLVAMAETAGVDTVCMPELPYQATALIAAKGG